MTQRIDLMPDSCRAKLGRKKQIRFWIAMYVCTAIAVVSGNMLFELSKRQVRVESGIIASQVALDAEQRVKAKQLVDEINRVEQALDRNARIAWPIDLSEVIAVLGSQTPAKVYLTKIALVPRQERVSRSRAAEKDEKRPLPKTRLQIECSGVATDDHAMAEMVARLEGHPLFERIAIEHVRPKIIGGREVKEFGVTCEIDFYHRFEFERVAEAAEVVELVEPEMVMTNAPDAEDNQ